MAAGGSQAITDAMASLLTSLGGEIETGRPVASLAELAARARRAARRHAARSSFAIAGDRLPARYRRALSRFRYGPGVFKVDYALGDPVPWSAPECRRAGTVHIGGTVR